MSTAFGNSRSKYLFYCILAFCFLLPISQYLSSRLLVLIVVLSLFVSAPKNNSWKFWTIGWDAMLYLFVLVLGIAYSDDRATGWKVIETSLGLVAMPLIFSKMDQFRKEHMHQVLTSFSAGVVVVSLICLSNAFVSYAASASTEVFFFENFTRIVDSHPTYLAYYLIAAITFGLYLLYYERTQVHAGLIVLLLLFLFMVLMLTGGSTAFVSVLFVLAFFVLKVLLEGKTVRQRLTFVVVVVMIASLFTFNEMNRGESAVMLNDSWERLTLWESALQANPSAVFGVGTGDYKNILNSYYVSHGMEKFASANFNAHNQFIETYFAHGLVGLACLMILMGRPIYLSVQNGNALGTILFFPFIIYGITEVFFGRYQGVVFFAILHQTFLAFYESLRPSFSLKRA